MISLALIQALIDKIEESEDNGYNIPHALESFNAIIPDKNNVLLFLDYDGTLSEIVSDPDKAVLTDSMSKLLVDLSSMDKIYVIITTGRSIEKVRSFIPNNKNIHFAGNHGIEIEFANDHKDQLFVDEESVKLLHSAWKELQDEYKICDKYNGTQIEYKKYSMSLHYRNIKVEDETKAIQEISQIMTDLSTKYKIHLSEGKKVFELKCVADWNKGYAIKWMLENRAQTFKLKSEQSNVIFIGDDVTDEDGFDALLNYSSDDQVKDVVSSILVTHNKVRATKATYYVNKVKDVELFLSKMKEALK
eukprot:109509_1